MGLPQLNYLFNANTNLAKMLLIRHVLIGSVVYRLVNRVLQQGINILFQIFELEDALVEDGLYVGSLDDPDLCMLVIVESIQFDNTHHCFKLISAPDNNSPDNCHAG